MISRTPITPFRDPSGVVTYTIFSGDGLLFEYRDGVPKGYAANAQSCREIYEVYWQAQTPINRTVGYHASKPIDIDLLAARWAKWEKRLGIKTQSVFHRVADRPKLVVIALSAFWIDNHVRRAVVTLLLRMAIDYWPDGATFKDAVKSYELAKASSRALDLFLRGYTVPRAEKWTRDDWNWGWGFVGEYAGRTEGGIKRLLTKEPRKRRTVRAIRHARKTRALIAR